MVARSPPKQRRALAALDPAQLRETLRKVDKCMARLQELQYTVAGGNKVISGVTLSPRSTRGYLRTSLRCKQESLRLKSSASKKSPLGKLPETAIGEWRRMSLPAMLVGETVGEILQASQFAKEIMDVVANKSKRTALEDPKTPITQRRRKDGPNEEDSELKSRRKMEKQTKLQSIRSEANNSPSHWRARSHITFKVSPPRKRQEEEDKERESASRYLANRVSPRNRPWAKKTVLFPNSLFLTTDSTKQQKFCKTRSPVIGRSNNKHTTPHKFLIKSPHLSSKSPVKPRSPPRRLQSPKFLIRYPPPVSKFHMKLGSPPRVSLPSHFSRKSQSPVKYPPQASKFQVKLRSPPRVSISPTRGAHLSNRPQSPVKYPPRTSRFQVKLRSPPRVSLSPTRGVHSLKKPQSPMVSAASKFRRSFSPTRGVHSLKKSQSPMVSAALKFRRSFSPSRLAAKLVSPLKSRRKDVPQGGDVFISGLKQRPVMTNPRRFSLGRI